MLSLNGLVPAVGLFSVAVSVAITVSYVVTAFRASRSDYRGQHVVITGGSSGIGLALAQEYLKRGANVTIIARGQQRLEKAKEILQSSLSPRSQQRVEIASLDLTGNYDLVERCFENVAKQLGPIHVLCNCAGTSVAGVFEDLAVDDFDRMMRTNYLSAVYATRAVIREMKAMRTGKIIFVASQVAQASLHGFTAYGGSKWALRGLAEALQMEVKPYNIYVSISYPPDTDTEGYREEMKTKPKLTHELSASGVFSSEVVARDIINQSSMRYFGITTGLDGWMLKQVHAGMTPVNSFFEVLPQVLFPGLLRLIGMAYVLSWDAMISRQTNTAKPSTGSRKKD